MIDAAQLMTIAGKEFRDRLRNRWVLAAALVYAVFSLLIAWAGGAQQGTVGIRSVAFTVASLVSLAIYLVPLMSLLLGFDAIVGESERGSLDLLLSLPVTRTELLLGKYLGLASALALAMVLGFVAVGVLLLTSQGVTGWWHYGGFVLTSWFMGLAFLSLALLISVLAPDRTRATGLALVSWFFFVLVFDLLLVGLLVAFASNSGGQDLPWLLLLNPADVFRVMNVFSLDEVRGIYGGAASVPPAVGSMPVLAVAMAAWIVVPLLIARWRFGRQ